MVSLKSRAQRKEGLSNFRILIFRLSSQRVPMTIESLDLSVSLNIPNLDLGPPVENHADWTA